MTGKWKPHAEIDVDWTESCANEKERFSCFQPTASFWRDPCLNSFFCLRFSCDDTRALLRFQNDDAANQRPAHQFENVFELTWFY